MGKRKTEHRIKAIELHKQGFSKRQIAEQVGVSQDTVKTWIALYKNGQKDLLEDRPHTKTAMCKFLSVPRSSYYYWLKSKDCDDKDALLIESIREGHRVSRGTYGYRRMTIWLNRTYGITVNNKRVRRAMKKAGLQSAVRKKKFKKDQGTIHKYDNLLARNFYSSRPNDKMVTDVTYISTARGNVFLSIVKDLFDNSIRGYCLSRNNDLKLVADTLKETFADIKTDGENPILLHSDQGFQYTSRLYERLTAKHGIMPSISRKGNCFDNAAAENFFSHLKSELINRVKLKDYEEAKKLLTTTYDITTTSVYR